MSNTKFLKRIVSLAAVSTGGFVLFSGINIYKENQKFYEDFLIPLAKIIPPESSHNFALIACKNNLFPAPQYKDNEILRTKIFNQFLNNPIGIAAGFDKQGDAVEGLDRLGFGFVEVGSVTPVPQPGNPKPRVFRLPSDNAVINRYGFNSEGHLKVYKKLKAVREKQNFKGLLGVNLGKNKDSKDIFNDYSQGVKIFAPVADYLVINISSPNTPGLRNFQSKQNLKNLLKSVLATRNELNENRKIPILLKLAPDLSEQDLKDIVDVIKRKDCKIDGLIISNTTVQRKNLISSLKLVSNLGGLSGAPLKDMSTELIAKMYHLTEGEIPIIGVGGIFCGQDAFEKIQAGASAVQIYTALIYHGPFVVTKIKNELADILKQNGYKNVSEAVGQSNKNYLKDNIN